MKSNKFSLPSKKALIEDLDIEVVFVDATECEIERPQKNKSVTTPGRKKTHAEDSVDCRCENPERYLLYRCTGARA